MIKALLHYMFYRRHYYRVKFSYKSMYGNQWQITNTVIIRHQRLIEDHRQVKRIMLADIRDVAEKNKLRLDNGTIQMEPICYLGKW